LQRPLRCSPLRICSRAAATIRQCRRSTRPSNICLRRHSESVPSDGPDKNLAGLADGPCSPGREMFQSHQGCIVALRRRYRLSQMQPSQK
jgi:hypothetical protein